LEQWKTVAAEDCCGHGAATGPSQKTAPTTPSTTGKHRIRYTCPMPSGSGEDGARELSEVRNGAGAMDVVVDAGPDPEYVRCGLRFG